MEALDSILANQVSPEHWTAELRRVLTNISRTIHYRHCVISDTKLKVTMLSVKGLYRNKIPLNLIEIDCTSVNETMRRILHELRTRICDKFLTELRTKNQELCGMFDSIAESLFNFLCESCDSTMFRLRSKLSRCAFLYDYQALIDEDEMEPVMELATSRLNMRKEFVDSVLRARRENFELTILNMQVAIDQFKKKDPLVLTMDEMEQATEETEQLSKNMAEIVREAEQINAEEGLLDMELSPYLTLSTMTTTVETFDRLWHTVLSFHKNYEKWYYGPFVGLDAEKILYKLGRALTDISGARGIAEMVRGKVQKCEQFIPLLRNIRNPGLQKRHWEQISNVI